MRQLQTHARFGLLMSALALTAVSTVRAQETCATDDDCEHGYSCEQVGACPAIDCPEGSDCEAVDCDPASACVPAVDCEADADCAEGWKCASDERSDCADVAEPTCAPGEECVKPDPSQTPDCQTVTVTYCAPPWQLPCEEAADCGPGFECVEEIAMSCSGSGGSSGGGGSDPSDPQPPEADGGAGFAPPADDAALPPDEPGSCTSMPTGTFRCQLVETPCDVDADCGAGLTCQEAPSDAVCTSADSDARAPAEGSAGAGAGGAGGDDGADAAERPAPPCETPEPTFACAPPSFFDGYGYGGGFGRDESTSGGVVTPDGEGGGSDPNGLPPATPVDSDGSETATGDDGAAGSGMSESSGCSATRSSHASGSALLMVLAALGLAVRRRSLRA